MTTVGVRQTPTGRAFPCWGHQARCDCGWQGEIRLTRTGAVLDGSLHFCEHARTPERTTP